MTDRLVFDVDRIRSVATRVREFHTDFADATTTVRTETDRSETSFAGIAGDAFRAHCHTWLASADELAGVLAELDRWMSAVADGYEQANEVNRAMFR